MGSTRRTSTRETRHGLAMSDPGDGKFRILSTSDAGRSWRTVDTGSYGTVDRAPDLGCWAAGEKGRVARLEH
ncbi:hypothetical protein GCM10027074_15030 [Streptomyces deserti]